VINTNQSINLKGKMYIKNHNGRKGFILQTTIPLTRPFRYRGVHPNAKFDGIFNIGAVGVPGENVAVQAWSANETSGLVAQNRKTGKPKKL
jgi:hypothetical protein